MPTHEEGFARLRNLLDAATRGERATFEALFARLQVVLREILARLENEFEGQIDLVLATGEWGERGIDLRNLPYDDVVLLIVLSDETRSFERYQQIANRLFADLHDEDVFVQFALLSRPEWQRAEASTHAQAWVETLGTLLWTGKSE